MINLLNSVAGGLCSSIPLRLNLSPSSISIGQTIRIVATALPLAKRFHINFLKDIFTSNDIPIHLSFRWDEGIFSNRIVYNTQKNGTWGSHEVRIKHPFKREIEFDLRIRFLTSSIQIFGDRKLLGIFKVFEPISSINGILIDGDLAEVRYIHYGGKIYPMPYNSAFSMPDYKQIDISGMSKGNRIDFCFYDINEDCVFLISIRFKEKAVVRNTQKNQKWGFEERDGGLPIKFKQLFDLSVINEEQGYQIFFNNRHFKTYAHRINATNVRNYRIDGDVELHDINSHKTVIV